MHLHRFGRGVGGPRIIENLLFSMNFHCAGSGVERARAAPDSLKSKDFSAFAWFRWWGARPGGPGIIENKLKFPKWKEPCTAHYNGKRF